MNKLMQGRHREEGLSYRKVLLKLGSCYNFIFSSAELVLAVPVFPLR